MGQVISYVAEYDLPAYHRRKRFYRAIAKYLTERGVKDTEWSTGSVVFTKSLAFAWYVYDQARAVGGVANVYEARRLDPGER